MGWVTYGLGSENENLPSFVVMVTGSVGGAGNSMWGSGFLPIYQGVEFRVSEIPCYFSRIHGELRRQTAGRSSIRLINSIKQLLDLGDPGGTTRIGQYEMA